MFTSHDRHEVESQAASAGIRAVFSKYTGINASCSSLSRTSVTDYLTVLFAHDFHKLRLRNPTDHVSNRYLSSLHPARGRLCQAASPEREGSGA
jgi:hypothetical protein